MILLNKDQVTKALKRYRTYKHAVSIFDKHVAVPAAGVANYEAMPSGSGAPELFFAMVGSPADMGRHSIQDEIDYINYRTLVIELSGALQLLRSDERQVVTHKWMDDINLQEIADGMHVSFTTIVRLHKSGLNKLCAAMRFSTYVDIECR